MIHDFWIPVNALNAPFWKGVRANQLLLPWCPQTEQFFWPPCPFSPFDPSGPTEWREAGRQGTLVARVIFRRSFQRAFEALMPYGAALVALDCGPRLFVFDPEPDGHGAPVPGAAIAVKFARLFPDSDIESVVPMLAAA